MIADLMFAGTWHDLVVLARWTHPFIVSLCQSLDPEWIQNFKGKHAEVAPPDAIDATTVDSVVSSFRKAIPNILASVADAEQVKALRMEFSGCVEAMQAHAASLRPQTRQTHHLIALPESFARQVLAGLDLRSRSSLKRHAAKFIECLPEGFRPSLHVGAEDRFASSTSLVSGQLYLDLAMLVFHRKRMSSIGQVFIFAWGDSTTKGHLDMYNTRHRWLPADRSVDLARAFRWLCSHQLKTRQ